MIYTAFCRSADDTGTTWIDAVEADNEHIARQRAEIQCAQDWNYDWNDVVCVGLAEGDVKIVFWEDISDD